MADLMEEIGAPESRYREVFTSLNSSGYISIDDDHDTTTVRLGERAAVVAQLHWNIEALSEGISSGEAWEILEDALD
jgi:DNA-binding IclR family transcriptional regulator